MKNQEEGVGVSFITIRIRQLRLEPCGGIGVIWGTFFSREVVLHVQRSCGDSGGFGMCFDCLEGGDHVRYGCNFRHVTGFKWRY